MVHCQLVHVPFIGSCSYAVIRVRGASNVIEEGDWLVPEMCQPPITDRRGTVLNTLGLRKKKAFENLHYVYSATYNFPGLSHASLNPAVSRKKIFAMNINLAHKLLSRHHRTKVLWTQDQTLKYLSFTTLDGLREIAKQVSSTSVSIPPVRALSLHGLHWRPSGLQPLTATDCTKPACFDWHWCGATGIRGTPGADI